VEDIKLKRWQKNQEISKLKSRKFDLVRTIDKTESDLNHLRQEIDRLKAEAAALESTHGELGEKNSKIRSEIDASGDENIRLNNTLNGVRNDLNQEQAAAEEVRTRFATASQDLDRSKALLMDRMTEEARYKNIYQNAASNRENLQRRIKRADEQAALAQQKVADGRDAETKAQADLEKARRDVAELSDQLVSVRKQTDDKRIHLAAQVKQVQTLAFERNNANTRYAALKKMEENFEWYRDGVKAVMKARQFNSAPTDDVGPEKDVSKSTVNPQQTGAIIGLLADIIEPEAAYRTAVEAALGESLQYILVNSVQTGVQAIQYLQSTNAGRSGFIPMAAVESVGDDRQAKPDTGSNLLQHVRIKPGYEKIARTFLGHVIVADDIDQALNDFNHNNARLTIVTRGGDLITRQGIMIGGSKEKLSGILAKKQEIKELEARIATYDRSLASARQTQDEVETEVRGLETNLQQLSERLNACREQEVEAEKQLYIVSEELKHALRHLEITELEQEQLLGEESDIDDEIANCNSLLNQLSEDVEAQKEAVTVKARQVELVSSELEGYNRNIVDLKLNLTTINARLENSNNTLRRLQEFLDDGDKRFDQIAEDIVRKNQKAVFSEEQTGQFEAKLTTMYGELKLLERNLDANESDFSSIDTQLKDSDTVISEITGKRQKLQEKLQLLEIEQTQRSVQRDNIAERLEENYDRPFNEYRKDLKALIEQTRASSEAIQTDALEEEIARLRHKIASIGDVNLGAINEYDTLKSRWDFLCEQRDDLHKAIEDLHRVINKINRITQQRFLETFNRVNEKLKEVFPRLFEGGTARLVLTDPQNPLETGVEYMVHPPGKKLTRMSLLSGGEKALSAIAFIFSLFLMKPASFCLMDEIDAPLDDANVYRFNDLLKLIGENSQIVLVTHNKRSMEFADTLFGITMESKGVSKVVSVNLN
jgi:chromosome segregation protein